LSGNKAEKAELEHLKMGLLEGNRVMIANEPVLFDLNTGSLLGFNRGTGKFEVLSTLTNLGPGFWMGEPSSISKVTATKCPGGPRRIDAEPRTVTPVIRTRGRAG
jgi:hypothetical protein